ncbi:phage terminase small subunit P27 family [Malikia sp.]|uniref:phage terminase small subunit P27 family n=1 Tax=Malikia sp. TaxID=2070706 RepID=UPI00261B8AB9|nr:phage terminase small subunit P27 family [Malikia sp.]MDD2728312.1 phage terminase small subunit P27 family [Malikia sp.]
MTGSRGPLPKPAALKLLEGNPGKRALDMSAGVNPRIEIPTVPRHLGPEARKEWKRITPLLEELGLISGLDRTALALYCQAVGRLAELETAFNGQVARLVEQEGIDYADAVYRASHAITPSGYAQQSVMVQLIKSHREQVNRYLMHFGLSPAARGRVQASNYVQPTLPGIDEKPHAQANGFARFAVVGGGR